MCSKIQFRSLDFSLSELIFSDDLCLGLSENTCFSKILKQCLRSYLKTVVCVCVISIVPVLPLESLGGLFQESLT